MSGQPSQLQSLSLTLTSRVCSQCKEEKDETHFSWRRDGKRSRLTSRCKECRSLNYKENPEVNRERAKKHYYANQQSILQGVRARYERDPARRLLNSAKRRAKEIGCPFDLGIEDIIIPSHCPVLGVPLKANKGVVGPDSPTLDRITGRLGYVKGNVVVVSFRANTIKSDATMNELRRVVAFYESL